MNPTIGNYRWRIVALLFFATTVNYIDRNVLSFAMIDDAFRHSMLGIDAGTPLTEADVNRFKEMMGMVDAAFKAAYAIGFLLVGYLIDKLGTRKGFSLGIGVWSLAGVVTGFTGSIKGISASRFLLGLSESANFPASIKTVAEWFPKNERSFATGLFNAGANIGVIVTALAVPYITLNYGWRAAFIATGMLGFVVLLLWRLVYRKPEEHPKLSTDELAYIQADKEVPSTENIPWWKLLRHRQTWAFAAGKFLADPIWYFYLTWLPDFFNSGEALEQKLDLKNIGLPFIVIYLVSDAGSIFFGWLSSKLIQNGWSVNRARKLTMLMCALCVMPIVFAATTNSVWVAVGLIALAAAAHQGWSANIFTLASDMFPKKTLGSVVGIGSMCGATCSVLFAYYAGTIRVHFGYLPLFAIAACAYLVALLLIHLLSPKLEPAKL